MKLKFTTGILPAFAYLVAGCASIPNDAIDPFSPSPHEEAPTVLKSAVFTFHENNPYPPGHPKIKYSPLDHIDDLIDPTEFDIIRLLQKNGVDFIGVNGSMVSLSRYDRMATATTRLYKYHIVITQTESNIKIAEAVLARYNARRETIHNASSKDRSGD
ncbi:MAG: hypothetical protein ABII82_16455 [Verrucomicrobiota bacterium]